MQALKITIQKREKELAVREDSLSQEEMERKRQALINAESNSVSS